MAATGPVCVVETPEFIAATRRLMGDEERTLLVDYLAYNPTAGDLIQGTGGVRKLRWALGARGKSGGARVIYYYHNPGMPVFAISIYAKSEQSDLSQQDRNAFKQLTALLAQSFKRKNP